MDLFYTQKWICFRYKSNLPNLTASLVPAWLWRRWGAGPAGVSRGEQWWNTGDRIGLTRKTDLLSSLNFLFSLVIGFV